jgi:hypothetical protein
MYQPYARFANPQTQLDATAKNPVGCIYSLPANQNLPLSTKGIGAQPVYKYVYFNAVAAPTAVAAPAPVYWTDESFTTVSSHAADSYSNGTGVAGVAIAGYWMPNTTALGTSQTAAQWGTQFQQSYGWIQIGGFLAGGWAPTAGAAAIGNFITGLATGDWSSTSAATITAGRLLGIQYSAVAASICDILVGGYQTFWGS